jgi:tRNA 2-selenouridine synthase
MKREHGVVSATDALRDLDSFDTVVDVRSESEYAEDHIPRAVSCPVLTDAQRSEVGTLDRQQSSFEARRRGAPMVARNIARHLEERFAQMPPDWSPLVYCWRGGQRSGAMTHFLARVGWRPRQLVGGYRAYRRAVMAELESLPATLTFRVICGTTGSGKSRLLQQLATAGAQVLDLEALARHRGSVLGSLPQEPQPGQKYFETLVWDALRRFDAARTVFVESESRKVGNVRVPDALLARMRESGCVRLDVPLPARVRLLRDEYAHFERDIGGLMAQLDCLVELHGHQRVTAWKAMAQAGEWDRLVQELLSQHYDPAYQRSIARNFRQAAEARRLAIASDDAADYAAAARELAA